MIRGSAVLCVAVLSARGSQGPDLRRENDAKSWRVIDADASVEGPVVRLKPHGDPAVGSHIGLAVVQHVRFSEGTLEIDLRGAGQQQASFLGLALGIAEPGRSKLCTLVRSNSQTTTRTRAVTRCSMSRGLSTHGRSCAKTSPVCTKPPSSPFRIRRVVSRPHRSDEAKSQRLG